MLFMCGQPIKIDIELYSISKEYNKNELINIKKKETVFNTKLNFCNKEVVHKNWKCLSLLGAINSGRGTHVSYWSSELEALLCNWLGDVMIKGILTTWSILNFYMRWPNKSVMKDNK